VVVDVIFPCLDEAAALPWVLERCPTGYRPIVVDNGSTDGSAEIAPRCGATVVYEPQRGFGAACNAGLAAATADILCFCDCDASLNPRQLPDVAGPVVAGEADLGLGRRRPSRALRGRCMPGSLTRRWPGRSLPVPASACMILVRCVQPGGNRCSIST
jgi:glycosyltransferase involved in cell wall biosynthesis